MGEGTLLEPSQPGNPNLPHSMIVAAGDAMVVG
jgi:hypothetical protein